MATKKTGFDSRMRLVRERLGFDTAESFASVSGVSVNTYRRWENRDSSPQIASVKAAFKALREPGSGRTLRDLPVLFCWIADGDGEEPDWLRDESLDPYAPEAASPDDSPPTTPGRVVPAMPWTLLTERVAPALRKVAAKELQNAEGRGDLEFVEIATAFERWLRSVRPQSAEGGSGTDASRSNLLNWRHSWASSWVRTRQTEAVPA